MKNNDVSICKLLKMIGNTEIKFSNPDLSIKKLSNSSFSNLNDF